MVSKRMMSLIFALAITGVANAVPVNFNGTWVEVEYWGGSGSNEAIVVIDFDATGGDSYTFGFKWDSSATGYDAIDTIAAAGALSFDATYYSGMGYSIDNFYYDGESGNVSYYWSYWLSEDGTDWTMSGVGASGRVLSNGSWDGWYNNFSGTAPRTPIPEPMTVALLGLGGLLLLKRRRA